MLRPPEERSLARGGHRLSLPASTYVDTSLIEDIVRLDCELLPRWFTRTIDEARIEPAIALDVSIADLFDAREPRRRRSHSAKLLAEMRRSEPAALRRQRQRSDQELAVACSAHRSSLWFLPRRRAG